MGWTAVAFPVSDLWLKKLARILSHVRKAQAAVLDSLGLPISAPAWPLRRALVLGLLQGIASLPFSYIGPFPATTLTLETSLADAR